MYPCIMLFSIFVYLLNSFYIIFNSSVNLFKKTILTFIISNHIKIIKDFFDTESPPKLMITRNWEEDMALDDSGYATKLKLLVQQLKESKWRRRPKYLACPDRMTLQQKLQTGWQLCSLLDTMPGHCSDDQLLLTFT